MKKAAIVAGGIIVAGIAVALLLLARRKRTVGQKCGGIRGRCLAGLSCADGVCVAGPQPPIPPKPFHPVGKPWIDVLDIPNGDYSLWELPYGEGPAAFQLGVIGVDSSADGSKYAVLGYRSPAYPDQSPLLFSTFRVSGSDITMQDGADTYWLDLNRQVSTMPRLIHPPDNRKPKNLAGLVTAIGRRNDVQTDDVLLLQYDPAATRSDAIGITALSANRILPAN